MCVCVCVCVYVRVYVMCMIRNQVNFLFVNIFFCLKYCVRYTRINCCLTTVVLFITFSLTLVSNCDFQYVL